MMATGRQFILLRQRETPALKFPLWSLYKLRSVQLQRVTVPGAPLFHEGFQKAMELYVLNLKGDI